MANGNMLKFKIFLKKIRKNYILYTKKQTDMYKVCRKYLSGKEVLEIGGPSKVFTRLGVLPVYDLIGHLDHCNYAEHTIWNDEKAKNNSTEIDSRQFIAEATALSPIVAEAYDGLLASHVIEHTANPLLALSEWIRVLKNSGLLVLLVPHRDNTFDHNRPVTKLSHMIEDFQKEVDETDLTHLTEILDAHDFSIDPGAGTVDEFKKRSLKNIENRCLHHHVFDTSSVISMIDYMRLQILALETKLPCHIMLVARKTPPGQPADNKAFIGARAAYRFHSPFASDLADI